MDKSISIFLVVDGTLLLILCLIKTLSFFAATRKPSLGRWLYFSKYEIFNAPNATIQSARVRQNKLSVTILSVLILSPIVFLIVGLFLN